MQFFVWPNEKVNTKSMYMGMWREDLSHLLQFCTPPPPPPFLYGQSPFFCLVPPGNSVQKLHTQPGSYVCNYDWEA